MGYSNTIKSDAGDFAACRRRVSLPMAAKKPKCHRERHILRQSFISVGAAHWAARRGGRLRSHPHLSRLRRASLPLLAFGHFPLTGGIGLSPCRGKAFGRVLDPPLRRIWERPRYSRKGRSQTGPRAHTVRPYDGKRTTHQDRSPHPSGLRPHLPLKGKATGDRKGRPYGENAPGALAEKTQAPLWNRTRP